MQRSVTISLVLAALALFALTPACGEPTVERPDAGGFLHDSGASEGPPHRPDVSPPPAKTPYPVLTLHGTAPDAKRVIVEGGDNPVASAVLPDGSFCVDVPLKVAGGYKFQITAQGTDGQVSEAAGPIAVELDPTTAGTPGAQTCSGADPSGQVMPPVMPAMCMDDALEPNNDPNAPRIEPGRYDHLEICPRNADYFGVAAKANQVIDVRIYFTSAMGQLDLSLLAGGDHHMMLGQSTRVGDDQSLTYTATVAGEYVVEVFGTTATVSNSYSMDLRLTP